MTKVIAVTNQKGGCGKTSTVINLSSCFAQRGFKTLAVDIDHQADLTKVLGDEDVNYEKNCGTLIDNQRCHIDECVIQAVYDKNPIENLFLLPSHISLSRIVEQNSIKPHKEKLLQRHFENSKKEYDYIIFDCPPNLSLGFMNAVYMSDYFLIPIDGGKFALDGLGDLLEAISEIRESDISDLNYYVFRNEYAVTNKLINDFIDSELSHIEKNVLSSKVRRSEAVGQASVTSMPVKFYSKSALVLNDYSKLCDELLFIIENR